MKTKKKGFTFSDKSVWSCNQKNMHKRREYFSSGVNVLTNSLEISEVTKTEFFQLNLSWNHGKIGK